MAARFPTTQWSMVLAARGRDGEASREALEALCHAYWYPLYAYVRSRGQGPEASRDLTQGFFADLLGRDFLAEVAPERGRFRAFLLASLRNFLSHERERSQALKRGGGVTTVSIDDEDAEGRFGKEPVDRLTPDQLFERRWGLTVMQRAMERLGAASRPEPFERLKGYLTGAEDEIPYREAAAALGLSEAAVKTAVHRLRKEYGRFLREEIAATVADPADLDDELKHLLGVIRPWRDVPP
jgi:RNA polymerase sigma-70 factor (ECF subfamily)